MFNVSDNSSVHFSRDAELADLGELAGPLAHDFNNMLNALSFQLEVMKLSAPAEFMEDFGSLQRQVGETAARIERFQQYRSRSGAGEEIVDLNQAVTRAVEIVQPNSEEPIGSLPLGAYHKESSRTTTEGAVEISLELQDYLPPVRGQFADVVRLCRFLLHNALRPRGTRMVVARTTRHSASVELAIEDDGPTIHPSSLARIFELGGECRDGMCCLELAASATIARRLNGTIKALQHTNGGLSIAVTLPL
jgi:signal transduction histidine kinase